MYYLSCKAFAFQASQSKYISTISTNILVPELKVLIMLNGSFQNILFDHNY